MKLNFWQYTTLALIIVILLLSGCVWNLKYKNAKLQKDCDQKLVKADSVTIVKHDTVPFDVVVYVPQPYAIKEPVPIYVLGPETVKEVDTAAILKDYYSTRFYSDTQKLERATVIINDQISENRIKQRQLSGNIIHDSITTTITNTIEAKKKNGWYVGITGNYFTWNKQLVPSASLLFISKKDFGIEAGAGLFNDKLFYSGSLKLKLHR